MSYPNTDLRYFTLVYWLVNEDCFGEDLSVCPNQQFYIENFDKITFLNENFLLAEKCFSSGIDFAQKSP